MPMVALLFVVASLPRAEVPLPDAWVPAASQRPARPVIPEAPALEPKQSVELDLDLAGDVTRPAPAPRPAPDVSLRPRAPAWVEDKPELREAALAILRGWLETLAP